MRRRSICSRMFLAFLVTMTFNTFFLIVLAWFIGPSFLYTMRDINVRNIVHILEKELSGNLSESDLHGIQDSLDEILLMDTGIEACRVYDNAGRSVVFALNGWREDYPGLPDSVNLDRMEEYGTEIKRGTKEPVLSKALYLNEELSGGIIVQYSRTRLYEEVNRVSILLAVHTLILLILEGVFFYFIIRRISSPLSDLSRIMRHYGELDFKFDYNYRGNDEIGDLTRSLHKMSGQIEGSFKLLRNSEERFDLAVRGSRDGIWDYDTANDTLYASTRCREILNMEQTHIISLKDWIDHVTEDDKDSMLSAIHMLLQNEQDMLDLECRVKGEENGAKWIHLKGQGIFSEEGKCLRIAGSLTDISHQKKTETKLLRAAMYDSLTGLPNRIYLQERLRQVVNRRKRRPENQFALLFLDYDGFKKVNDTYGHHVGDQILRHIARRLKRCLRPEDLISRIGGDEFVILLEDCGGKEEIAGIARRILASSAKEFKIEGISIFLSVSIGIATDKIPFNAPEDIIQFSDIAMYNAKSAGKGTYRFYRKEMHSRISDQWKIQNDLHKAIRRDELFLVYHPIVSLENCLVEGAEALMRWNHPVRGMISPADFIPAAEETQLIVQLTDWMLGELISVEPHQLLNPEGKSIRLSFNLSSRDFLDNPSILKRIQDRIPMGSPLWDTLDAEVTETTLIDNFEAASYQLARLRSLGMKTKLDDFGTGFSSLSYLHSFPLDELKIDRSFVSSIPENTAKVNIIRHIINLAHDLNLKVIAEGIERVEQHQVLKELGCDMGQGYLYTKPLKLEEFRKFLSKKAVEQVSEWGGGILFI